MPFIAVTHPPHSRTNWQTITHIRLLDGKKPDTPSALKRWEKLRIIKSPEGLPEGLIELDKAIATLEPVRNLQGRRESSIKRDLRYWSNSKEHGNNSQDKGWLELGYMLLP